MRRHSYRNTAANYSAYLIWALLLSFIERAMGSSSVCFFNGGVSLTSEKLSCIDDQADKLFKILSDECLVTTPTWNDCPTDPLVVTHYGHGTFGGSVCTLSSNTPDSSTCVNNVLQKNVRNAYGTDVDVIATCAISAAGALFLVLFIVAAAFCIVRAQYPRAAAQSDSVSRFAQIRHSCSDFFKRIPNPCNLVRRNEEGEGRYLLENDQANRL